MYEYHRTAGCRRSFEYLRSRGVTCDRVTEGPLDADKLSKYRVLFINLCSAEREPFLVSEIAAIRSFVAQGGSLFVVTDHSNAYLHAHMLKPLLAELDIVAQTSTACEAPPRLLAGGNGWISVVRFKPHPVTAGLKCIAMQTGTCVDPRFAVAMTSEKSWADAWSPGPYCEKNCPGFIGNLVRDPGERSGPLGIVLAKTFGRGRIAITGDQNMLGGNFIHYADNYRLWLNIMAWLLGDQRISQPEPYEQWRSPRVVCYERFEDAAWARNDRDGDYHAWSLLTRYYWAFAGNRLSDACDLIVFAYNDCDPPPGVADSVAAHLRRGKNVLVLNAASHTLWEEPGAVGQVLKAMGVSRPTTRSENGKLVVELPAAGQIHILGPDQVLDNGTLPPPTRVPTEAENRRNGALLAAVHEALGGVTPPASASNLPGAGRFEMRSIAAPR